MPNIAKKGIVMKTSRHLFITQAILMAFAAATVFAAPSPSSSDPGSHSVYSTYKFGSDRKVIDFAIAPVAIPAGVLSETIKRDNVLRQSLQSKGVELRFHSFKKGKDANFFMGRGDVEAAIFADIPALTQAATYDTRVVALAKQGFSSIVTTVHTQLGDLKGKRIGNVPGSTSHYALMQTLASAGLKEIDVRIVPMEAGEMPAALADGRIDAFAAWEPAPAIALGNNPDARVINRFISMSFLYFSKSFIDQNPDAARQIVSALVRAISWLKQDKKNLLAATSWAMEANRALTGKGLPLSLQQAAALTTSDILAIPSTAAIPAADLKKQGYLAKAFEFLKTQGQLPANAQWDKTLKNFDNRLLTEVLSNPSRYKLKKYDYTR